jgi:hypothetical protein
MLDLAGWAKFEARGADIIEKPSHPIFVPNFVP